MKRVITGILGIAILAACTQAPPQDPPREPAIVEGAQH